MTRNRELRVLAGAVVMAFVLSAGMARAQFTTDYQTNIINGVYTTSPGSYIVGSNYVFDALQLIGGYLSNGTVYVGYEPDANNNAALVTGAGSVWFLPFTTTSYPPGSDLYVGYSGAGNSLTISNSGKVDMQRALGVVGYANSSSNNMVVVKGIDSVWQNPYGALYVGYSGAGNSLTIADGGTAYTGGGVLGQTRASSNNTMLVTGIGSVWSSPGLDVGYSGAGNSLTISNSGAVYDTAGHVGGGSDSSNNTVLVTGIGSVWRNREDLYIGNDSSSLTIADGGGVYAANSYLGSNTSSRNNAVLVTGGGSVLSNRLYLYVGYYGSDTSLVISNGGVVANRWTSTIGWGVNATSNSVLVTGTGSVWSNGDILNVGGYGSGNFLVVNNGGTVVAANVIVGSDISSSNNLVTLNGGNMIVANGSGAGMLDVRRGTVTLNSGSITVDRLIVINGGNSVFTFNGGILITGGTTITNGSPLTAGDGVSVATLNLQGGTHSFASGLVVSSNALLKGTGTIYGDLTLAGTLAPGNSPGAITNVGILTLQSSAVLDMELGGRTQGSEYDYVLVNGNVTLGGSLRLSFINGFETNVLNSDTFTLLTATNVLTGSFANVLSGQRLTTAAGEGSFLVSYNDNNLVLSDYQVIPEPGTLALCGLGLVMILGLRQHRRDR